MCDNSFEDEVILGSSKLSGGLVLRDLLQNGTAEFSLEVPDNNSDFFREETESVETVYDYDEYANLINLDCMNIDSENIDTQFSELASKMTNVTEDGGVKKLIKQHGLGVKVPHNGVVYVHYSVYKELEEVPLDSSYLRSQKPVRYQLGVGALYYGFELAVASMTENEKAQFLVQPDYAFGKMGAPPRIPPNATLLLDIHLISSVDCGALLEINENNKSFKVAFKKAKSYHILGNDYFSHKNISTAVDNYKKAEHLLLNCSLMNDEEEKDQKHLLMKIYTNLSVCYNNDRMKMPEKTCITGREATRLDPELARKNSKLHYQWGRALAMLSDFNLATKHYKMALDIEPNNVEIIKQLKELSEKKKNYLNYEQITYSKALGLKTEIKENLSSPEDIEVLKIKEKLMTQLGDFVKSKSSRLQLPEGLAEEEKSIIRSLCDEMGLRYHEQSTEYSVKICILK